MLALGVGQRYFLYCAGFVGSRDSMKVLRPHSGLMFRTGLPIYIGSGATLPFLYLDN